MSHNPFRPDLEPGRHRLAVALEWVEDLLGLAVVAVIVVFMAVVF